jgi:DNA anti-recombination protein RmuC
VRLTVGEWSETANFDVVQDPRTNTSQEAFDEQYAFAREIWQALTRSHETIEQIRDVRGQIEAISALVEDEAIKEKAEEISKALTGIEEKLTQVKNESSQDVLNFQPQIDNQLLNLQSVVESSLGAPNASSREVFALLEAELDGYVAELDGVLADQLPELERLLEESQAPRVVLNH